MRVVFALMVVPLVGCSNLLGIQDPSAGSGSGSDIDAGIDAMVPPSGDFLKISIADFKAATKQRVRFHVSVMHKDATSEDVSQLAGLTSSDASIATAGPVTAAAATIDAIASGTATITAKYNDAAPATVKITVMPTLCRPVINEFSTGTALDAENEFVEIYDPCTDPSYSVDNWSLVYRASTNIGTTEGAPLVALAGTMAPGDLRVYAGQGYPGAASGTKWAGGLKQDSGAVALRNSVGDLISSVSYGTVTANHPFTETAPAPPMANDKFATRAAFDGNDSGDNSKDFTVVNTGTPGALNVP